ncbi:hypothetical protein PUN4_280019 [Paraburkholderia unamae]|nr:hypothetical protein PUN4_280019 [Paraburkholderia unamae]
MQCSARNAATSLVGVRTVTFFVHLWLESDSSEIQLHKNRYSSFCETVTETRSGRIAQNP